jgi:hypothetical protein
MSRCQRACGAFQQRQRNASHPVRPLDVQRMLCPSQICSSAPGNPPGELLMPTPHGRFLAMLTGGHHYGRDVGQPPGSQVTGQQSAVTG